MVVNDQPATAIHGKQSYSFISETFERSLKGPKLQSLPKNNDLWYQTGKPSRKNPKQNKVRISSRVLVDVVYPGAELSRHWLYVVPKEQSLKTDIVVGTEMRGENPQEQTRSEMPLAIR